MLRRFGRRAFGLWLVGVWQGMAAWQGTAVWQVDTLLHTTGLDADAYNRTRR